MRFVAAWSGLLQPHRLALALGADYYRLQVEKISVIALFVQRLDADVPISFVHRNIRGEISILQPAQAPLRGLRPELAVLLPAQPLLRPLGFGIGGERHRAA